MPDIAIDFNAPNLGARIETLNQYEIDQLPFGVILPLAAVGVASGRTLVTAFSRPAIAGDNAEAMLVAPTSQRARPVHTGAHSSRLDQILTCGI